MKSLHSQSLTEHSRLRCSSAVRRITFLLLATGLFNPLLAGDDTEFFEEKIQPVLVDYCYKCHSDEADEPAGGLFLHTREGIREGGELGPAVVPEDIDESLLISALEYRDLEMPPDGQLDEAIIADFRKWIEMGAPDPRSDDEAEPPKPMAKAAPATGHSDAPLKHPAGAEFELDKNKQVVGVEYKGTPGLQAMGLHELPHLRSVRIAAFTTLSADDVDYLSKLEGVVELTIGNDQPDESVNFEGDISKLGEMKSLESLFVCKHKMVDEDLEFIGRLPNLTHLKFNADTNPIHEDAPCATDDCGRFLSNATKLKSLQISKGDFSDKLILTLSKSLPQLEHLGLQTSQLTEESVQSLVLNCPNLNSLSLSSDSLTADCLLGFAGSNRLKHLKLNVPNVTNKGLRVLADLPQLETVGLHAAKLTSKQLGVFRNHPTLRSLLIDGSGLSLEEILNVIRTMPKLTHLGIGATTETLQSEINEFLKHRKID